MDNHRPGGFEAKGENAYLFVTDLITGQEVCRFGEQIQGFGRVVPVHVAAVVRATTGHVHQEQPRRQMPGPDATARGQVRQGDWSRQSQIGRASCRERV